MTDQQFRPCTFLPIHPRTGLRAVGVVGGRPVWPVIGGSGEGNEGQGGSQQSSGSNTDQQSQQPQQSTGGGGPSQAGGQQNTGQQQSSGQQAGGSGQQSVDQLPDWAQKIIRDTRDEAASNRTAKNTAEQDKQTTLDKIATALGLKSDDAKDPDKLAGDLTSARSETRQVKVELAVYRAAHKHEADPNALLDSRTFLESVRDLDPSEKDFVARVATRIQDAIKDNPRLKAGEQQQTGGQQSAVVGRSMGQGHQGQQSGPTGVAAGRALRQARKRPRNQQQNTT